MLIRELAELQAKHARRADADPRLQSPSRPSPVTGSRSDHYPSPLPERGDVRDMSMTSRSHQSPLGACRHRPENRPYNRCGWNETKGSNVSDRRFPDSPSSSLGTNQAFSGQLHCSLRWLWVHAGATSSNRSVKSTRTTLGDLAQCFEARHQQVFPWCQIFCDSFCLHWERTHHPRLFCTVSITCRGARSLDSTFHSRRG